MKNIIKSLALAALCVASFSCAKNENFVRESTDIHFTLRTGDVKTYMVDAGDKYSAMWNTGDEIGVLLEGFTSGKTAPAGKLTNGKENGAVAEFKGKITGAKQEGTLYAFYPSVLGKTYDDSTCGFDILASQKPTATSFDPAADLLISKPVYYIADETEAFIDDVQFARALAILKINVFTQDFTSAQGQYLSKVTVAATGGNLAGRPVFDLSAGDAVITKYNVNIDTVNALYEEDIVSIGATADADHNSVFLMVAPGTFKKDSKFTFSGVTDGYEFTKEVTLSGDLVLTPGKIKEINLSLAEANFKAFVETSYAGDWMIVGENTKDMVTTHYAMPAYSDGNNIKAVTYIMDGEKAKAETEAVDLNNCLYTVEKVTEGSYKGYYTIRDINGLYIYAASTSSNYLKASALGTDDKYFWTIECDEEGNWSVYAKSTGRNVLRFNYNGGSAMFSCYAAGAMAPVALFPWENVIVDTTPKIQASSDVLTINADGTVKGNPITVKGNKYVTGTITAAISGENSSWLTAASVSDGKLSVTAEANKKAAQRTAVITLSYEGAQDVVINVTQEAAELGSKSEINFEAGAATYTDWTFDGMTSMQTETITAHTGTYYGTTGGEATASITTKSAVKPQALTFYVSKTSTNTTTSTWKVQVSENGSTWTDVISQDATSMTKGTWVEVKADLKELSEVYVRIYYTGSTAVRAIDDVKLIYHTVSNLAISGEAAKKAYKAGDSFETTGLTVKATYTDESQKDVTDDVKWTITPSTLVVGTASVSVVASFGGVSTEPMQIDGITVTEAAALSSISVKTAPTKVVYKEGEKFDPDGLVITRNYSDQTNDEYAYAGHESEFTFSPALDAALATSNTSVTITYKEKSVSQTITVNDTALSTMDEIFAAATQAGASATAVKIRFTDCVVTGVKGNNAYLTDATGTKGLIIFTTNHGFAVGDKLNGKVDCKVQLFKGASELTDLTSTTSGLTVTKDGTVTPRNISIADLKGVNTGAVITFESLNYNGSAFSDGTNTIKPYNTFVSLPTLTTGKNYTVTGVFIQYDSTKEIAPRTTDDIKLYEGPYLSAKASKTSVAAAGETVTITVDTNIEGWTVTSDNAAFVVGTKSGNTVPVVVSENTSTTDDRTANITVSAAGVDDVVIALKQVKKGGVIPVDIAIDFTTKTQMPQGFPTASGTKSGTYKIAGYDFEFSAATAFYWSSYLMIGKSGSYILFPAISGMTLKTVEWVTTSGISESVICDIYSADGKNAVYGNTAKAKKSTTYTWDLTGKTSANTQYQFRVTNAYNCQIASLKLHYE